MGQRIRRWVQFALEDELGTLSHAEWVIYWTIVLTPVWWLLGIQTLLYPLLTLYLVVQGFNFDRVISQKLPTCVYAWLFMSLIAISLALMTLADMGLPLGKLMSPIITFLKGYFLIFSGFIIPFWHRVRVKVVTRAICWMAFGYAVTIAFQAICLYGRLWKDPIYPPLAKLIPGDKLSLLIKPAVFQKFFGITLPRTSIYMADPPIPGICGLLCYFMCRGEGNDRIRFAGVLGSVAALIVSQSRLAWVCYPISVLVVACFCQPLARLSSLWSMTGISVMSAWLGMTIKEMISQPMEVFTSARAESSADRALVVGKTLEAWQQSPWFGWGITQGSVKWHIYDIALGSFSSYASVLYHQGIFGFAIFTFALTSTLWNMGQLAIRGNLAACRAIAALLALYLLLEGLPLTWVAVYFWFFFIWLGAILSEAWDHRSIVPDWQHCN
ncbi:MAG: O-antigen ligase family protein [Synechococcales bacterium]|nr:O-antigen ligase family protein [Synechococcales bacterium]